MRTFQKEALRRTLSVTLALATVAFPILGRTMIAHATGTQKYTASDLIGQIDGSGNPDWTRGYYSSSASASASNLNFPNGTAIDTVHHRLFVTDCYNNRVLVYGLGTDNILTNRTAQFVIGQADFTSTETDDGEGHINASTLYCPDSPSYDPIHDRLFVAEYYDNRVLAYNLSGGISNGMPASYVIGQADFASHGQSVATMHAPYGGTAYDPSSQFLYVSDTGNARVLIYNLSAGITNNPNPAYVIGQINLTSNAMVTTQSGLSDPYGLALDPVHHRLFVADEGGGSNGNRVLVFDTSALANGMNATNVLGQPTFTTSGIVYGTQSSVGEPLMLAYDPTHQRLFVGDGGGNRITVFDVSTITNNQNAVAVIGQPNFTSQDYSCPAGQDTICDPGGLNDAFDPSTNRLYVSDSDNNRVLIYSFVTVSTASLVNPVLGTAYSSGAIQVQHAQGSVTFAITSGTLPTGLTLNPTTGAITGTATTAGSFSFTVTASDTVGSAGTYTDSKNYTVQIAAAVAPVTSAVPNNGDANADTIQDTTQSYVSGALSSDTGKYVAVQTSTACSLSAVSVNPAKNNAVQDSGYSYPAGFLNYTASCGSAGYTASVTVFAYEVSASGLVLRKYNPATHGYSTISGATIQTVTIAGQQVTKATYQVTDGGPLDADGTANGTIIDPVGLGELSVAVPNTGII